MFISSASIYSTKSCSYSPYSETTKPVVQNGWREAITGRIHQFPGSVEKFIQDLVPCSVPYDLNADLSHAFDEYKPSPGKGPLSYPGLISGLSTLVAPFEDRKIEFYDTHDVVMQFPFNAYKKKHVTSRPDISVSFPGESVPEHDRTSLSWEKLSMVMEAKSTRAEDPFPRDGQSLASTIVQIARSARNLMLTHGFLASFVVGVYGDIGRLLRVDHSSAVVSAPFNLKEDPHLLQRFLWHFTHPAVGTTVAGCDPTVRKLTEDDKKWVAEQLRLSDVPDVDAELVEFNKGRRMEVPSGPNGASTPYIVYRLLDVNARLFSRASTVWRTLEDTRVPGPDGTLVDDPQRVGPVKTRIMKEAWRQVIRTSEATFYERLASRIPEDERVGLPKLVCGGDLGQLEVLEWEKTSDNVACMEGQRELRVPAASSSNSHPRRGSTSSGSPYPLPYPQHQTFSWTVGLGKEFTYRERSHMRMVINDVGRPLTKFKNTKELVTALRDAVKGHRLAWEKAGVLHRDVSLGNILIVDEDNGSRFGGYLHDFDYSSMTDVPPGEPDDLPLSDYPDDARFDGLDSVSTTMVRDDQRKERTGTYYFMAIEILEKRVIHFPHHDLESFYWVLLWVVIRHTRHSFTETAAQKVFAFGDDDEGAGLEILWLEAKVGRLQIADNQPLVKLLTDFGRLVLHNFTSKRAAAVPLTYDAVLKVLDDALASPGWPASDFVPCKWFDKRGGATVPWVTSDHHNLQPIPAPPPIPAPSSRQSQAMPPPTSTDTNLRRSKRRSEHEAVDRVQPDESGTSVQGVGSSSKRRKTASSGVRSSLATRSSRRTKGSESGLNSRKARMT